MKRSAVSWVGALAVLVIWSSALAAATDRPVVRMPAVEQGGEVRGDLLVDVVMKPADDGTPLTKLDMIVDNETVITFDITPGQRNVTYNWMSANWSDGRHELVARVLDARGRTAEYRTFVYVWNQGRPKAGTGPASITVQDGDGQLDNVITQRALIQVKVDPKLGAKWVILYLNDQFIAMMNNPPYQEVLDPAKRKLADGPYIVRARVIHPDNSETQTDPVSFQVNLSGNYTPLRTQMGPGAVAETPLAGPAAVPAAATTPLIPVDLPGVAQPADGGLPAGAPAPVAAERTPGSLAVAPQVTDGGRLELSAPTATRSEVAGLLTATAAIPTVPAAGPAAPPARPTAIERRLPLGPVAPARTAAAPATVATVRDSGERLVVNPGADQPVALATPVAAPRAATQPLGPVAAPRTVATTPTTAAAPTAVAEATPGATARTMTVAVPPASSRRPAGATVVEPSRGTARPVSLPRPAVKPPVAAPRGALPTPARPQPAVARPATPRAIGRVHTVARGEHLTGISRRYGVTLQSLVEVNGLVNPSLLKVGQKLIIPGGALVVNGQAVKTDVAALQQRKGVATSPLRFVVEALGGSVTYLAPVHQVQATTRDRGVVTINIGKTTAQVNDAAVLMDLAAYIQHGRTMVPTRFISEALDVTVEVDESSGSIVVRSNR